MPDTTPRFALPLLQAGQAQKEVLHNEAILALETICQPTIETIGDTVPPPSPTPGASWIVGATPAGAWAGRAGALATWTDGGWRFVDPVDGMVARLRSSGLAAQRRGGAWIVGEAIVSSVQIGGRRVLGAQQPAIAAPTGGGVADEQGRAAIGQLLVALRTHGLIAS